MQPSSQATESTPMKLNWYQIKALIEKYEECQAQTEKQANALGATLKECISHKSESQCILMAQQKNKEKLIQNEEILNKQLSNLHSDLKQILIEAAETSKHIQLKREVFNILLQFDSKQLQKIKNTENR